MCEEITTLLLRTLFVRLFTDASRSASSNVRTPPKSTMANGTRLRLVAKASISVAFLGFF
jgi:hypothetical protein